MLCSHVGSFLASLSMVKEFMHWLHFYLPIIEIYLYSFNFGAEPKNWQLDDPPPKSKSNFILEDLVRNRPNIQVLYCFGA